MNRVVDALAPAALILLLLAGWEAACRLTGVPAYFLPPPSKVLLAAASGLTVLVPAAWNTLSVALIALALAAGAALALALLVGLSPLLERAVRPLASALQVPFLQALLGEGGCTPMPNFRRWRCKFPEDGLQLLRARIQRLKG